MRVALRISVVEVYRFRSIFLSKNLKAAGAPIAVNVNKLINELANSLRSSPLFCAYNSLIFSKFHSAKVYFLEKFDTTSSNSLNSSLCLST